MAGDRASGASLFDRHYRSITRFFRNKVGDSADLVQRTFLAALEAAPRFRGESSVRTWLFGIAHNVLLRHFRERRSPRATDPLPSASVEDLGESPSGVVAKHDEERLLLAALRRLPLEHQAMLELHYWEQLKVGEVAEVFEMPVGTVKVKMFRARKRLHELLEQMEASPEARHSTLTRLDDWAAGLREQLGPSPQPRA